VRELCNLFDSFVIKHGCELHQEEQVCPNCGGPLHEMSTEVRQELKVIPAQVKLVKHVRYVYSCRRCEREGTSTSVVTAPAPPETCRARKDG